MGYKYPDEHWEEVAKFYREAKVATDDLSGAKTEESVRTAKVQNHYPYTTYDTVLRWVRKCREKGLL
jgi:hypothetical protein